MRTALAIVVAFAVSASTAHSQWRVSGSFAYVPTQFYGASAAIVVGCADQKLVAFVLTDNLFQTHADRGGFYPIPPEALDDLNESATLDFPLPNKEGTMTIQQFPLNGSAKAIAAVRQACR